MVMLVMMILTSAPANTYCVPLALQLLLALGDRRHQLLGRLRAVRVEGVLGQRAQPPDAVVELVHLGQG